MAWVITNECRKCERPPCVEACPEHCIVSYAGPYPERWPDQLFIIPSQCTDCVRCALACQHEAIFAEEQLRVSGRVDDIEMGARAGALLKDFEVPRLLGFNDAFE